MDSLITLIEIALVVLIAAIPAVIIFKRRRDDGD